MVTTTSEVVLIFLAVLIAAAITGYLVLSRRLRAPTASEIVEELSGRNSHSATSVIVEAAIIRVMNGTADRVARIERMLERVSKQTDANRDAVSRIEDRLDLANENLEQIRRMLRKLTGGPDNQ